MNALTEQLTTFKLLGMAHTLIRAISHEATPPFSRLACKSSLQWNPLIETFDVSVSK